jgi:hypothetical protein
MALAAQLKVVDVSRRRRVLRLLITPSGNYTTGGDTLDLTQVTNPAFKAGGFFGGMPDDWALINCPGGYNAEYFPGTALNNGKIKFYSAAGTEIGAAAYPAILQGDPLEFEFSGPIGKI